MTKTLSGTTNFAVSETLKAKNVSANGVLVGNSSANAVINSTSIKLANSTSDITLTIPSSAAKSATNYFLNANGSWSTVSATGGTSATRVYQSFTATAGQNTFSVTGGYVNNYIDVFYNGVHLSNTEYTQNGTHIQLTENAIVGALVEVAGFKDISLADYTVNAAAQYTWTNTHTFSSNVVLTGVSANGSFGAAGYVLKSNGSSTYWDVGGGAASNVDSQYTWTNTHTFNGNVVIGSGLSANGSYGTAGQALVSNGSSVYWGTVSGGTGSGITANLVTASTVTAIASNRYVLTNASATTVTLPASPSFGDTVYIIPTNGLANNVVGRNGNKIMGLTEDLTIDVANTSIDLIYVDATLGWRII